MNLAFTSILHSVAANALRPDQFLQIGTSSLPMLDGEGSQNLLVHSSFLSQPSSSISRLGLGLGFGSLLLIPPQTLKPLSSTINLAATAVKAAAALRAPPSAPGAILLTSKALFKTYKASTLLTPRPPSPSSAAAKPLKSYLAAINLARYAPPVLISRSLGLTSGYKISKNLARVLEGLVGLQIDSAIRGRVGLLVKALIIVKEIERRFRSRVRFGTVRVAGLRKRVCVSSCRRSEIDCGVVPAKHFATEEMMGAKTVEVGCSDLLCLSIPVHEAIRKNSM